MLSAMDVYKKLTTTFRHCLITHVINEHKELQTCETWRDDATELKVGVAQIGHTPCAVGVGVAHVS